MLTLLLARFPSTDVVYSDNLGVEHCCYKVNMEGAMDCASPGSESFQILAP